MLGGIINSIMQNFSRAPRAVFVAAGLLMTASIGFSIAKYAQAYDQDAPRPAPRITQTYTPS